MAVGQKSMLPTTAALPCRGRYECCKALLRAGADPNYINKGHDLTLFWGIDGGVEIIKLLHQYGANLDARCDPAHSQLRLHLQVVIPALSGPMSGPHASDQP